MVRMSRLFPGLRILRKYIRDEGTNLLLEGRIAVFTFHEMSKQTESKLKKLGWTTEKARPPLQGWWWYLREES